MKIKKGNAVSLQITVKDSAGNLVTNLSTAIAVFYMIKENFDDPDASALVSKSLSSGIVVDSPSIGIVSITIDPVDTALKSAGLKFHALQIKWSATNIQEISLYDSSIESDKIELTQDVIR